MEIQCFPYQGLAHNLLLQIVRQMKIGNSLKNTELVRLQKETGVPFPRQGTFFTDIEKKTA